MCIANICGTNEWISCVFLLALKSILDWRQSNRTPTFHLSFIFLFGFYTRYYMEILHVTFLISTMTSQSICCHLLYRDSWGSSSSLFSLKSVADLLLWRLTPRSTNSWSCSKVDRCLFPGVLTLLIQTWSATSSVWTHLVQNYEGRTTLRGLIRFLQDNLKSIEGSEKPKVSPHLQPHLRWVEEQCFF